MGKLVHHHTLRDSAWKVWQNDDGTYGAEGVNRAILLDIRAELKRLNAIFSCPKVQHGFGALRQIAKLDELAFKRRVQNAGRKRMRRHVYAARAKSSRKKP